MNGLIIVSHSPKIAEGIVELVTTLVPDNTNLILDVAAGNDDHEIGTSPIIVLQSIQKMAEMDTIYIINDIGSSVISSETALDFLDETLKDKVVLLNAPIVEGAFVVSVQTSLGSTREGVQKAIQSLLSNYHEVN